MKVRVSHDMICEALQWIMDRGYYDEHNCELARDYISSHGPSLQHFRVFSLEEIPSMTPEDLMLFKLTFAS